MRNTALTLAFMTLSVGTYSFAAQERDGGDLEEIPRNSSSQYVDNITTDQKLSGIKKSFLEYIDTYKMDEITNVMVDGKLIPFSDEELKFFENRDLLRHLVAYSKYNIDKNLRCYDSAGDGKDGDRKSASAPHGTLADFQRSASFRDICFDYEKIDADKTDVARLLGILGHEHSHQLGIYDAKHNIAKAIAATVPSSIIFKPLASKTIAYYIDVGRRSRMGRENITDKITWSWYYWLNRNGKHKWFPVDDEAQANVIYRFTKLPENVHSRVLNYGNVVVVEFSSRYKWNLDKISLAAMQTSGMILGLPINKNPALDPLSVMNAYVLNLVGRVTQPSAKDMNNFSMVRR